MKIREIESKLAALVAIGVLLDGNEAGTYLEFDKENGKILKEAADELADQPPEIRMPLAGTIFREAMSKM